MDTCSNIEKRSVLRFCIAQQCAKLRSCGPSICAVVCTVLVVCVALSIALIVALFYIWGMGKLGVYVELGDDPRANAAQLTLFGIAFQMGAIGIILDKKEKGYLAKFVFPVFIAYVWILGIIAHQIGFTPLIDRVWFKYGIHTFIDGSLIDIPCSLGIALIVFTFFGIRHLYNECKTCYSDAQQNLLV